MRMFLILNVFYALFLSEKNKSEPVGCTSTMHLQTRKDTKGTEIFILHLLLIFEVYQDPLTQLPPLAWDFLRKGCGWSWTKCVNHGLVW